MALQSLAACGRPPVSVVTLPTALAHRHSDFVDLAPMATQCGSNVIHATSINSPLTIGQIRDSRPDLCLVIGWSQVCRDEFLSSARIGCIGFHPSPLPRLRGRAVIPWTILLGETESASTLFWLDSGLDSGPILMQRHFAVSDAETARTLYDKHVANISSMLPEAMALVESGSPPRRVQNSDQASYCAKRTADDGIIDWRQDAARILRLIRAVGDPYPGAFTTLEDEKLVVNGARVYEEGHRFVGMAGQVVHLTTSGFVVSCGDRECIEVTSWLPGRTPKLHAKLGGSIGARFG